MECVSITPRFPSGNLCSNNEFAYIYFTTDLLSFFVLSFFVCSVILIKSKVINWHRRIPLSLRLLRRLNL